MGLLSLLKRLLFGASPQAGDERSASPHPVSTAAPAHPVALGTRLRRPLGKLNYQSTLVATDRAHEIAEGVPPYRFAQREPTTGHFLNLAQDGDARWLDYYGLPHLQTPEEIAAWLKLPIGKVAWLTYRFCENHRPQSTKESHYHFRWLRKRSGGHRLIESPKGVLRTVQSQILKEMLNHVAAHPAAHGFVRGRSLKTNAEPHRGQAVVIKFDLDNFYASVRQSRVVAIFRSLGYSREAALWLTRLSTSAAPGNLMLPLGESTSIWRYMPRHLPQGASTSPALANLSAYGLDVRLSGLAKKFHANYTRYADDLTFSGDGKFAGALGDFITLVQTIIRDEGFQSKLSKRKILRRSHRQEVTGVVVNEKSNISRHAYDKLKAILHNCRRHGPASQNHANHPAFAAHLLGRIAHVQHINPNRGAKLLAIYQQIQWG